MNQVTIGRLLAAAAIAAASFGAVHAADSAPKPAAAMSAGDAALSAKVKSALVDMKDVNVNAARGQVVLTGSVATSADADRAIQVASTVDGVKKVTNELKVISSQQ
jgi:hyperosmotically inducible protein